MENHKKIKNENLYESDLKIWQSVTCGEGISTPQRPSEDGTFTRNKCDFTKCHFPQIITIIIRIKANKITKQTNIKNKTNI